MSVVLTRIADLLDGLGSLAPLPDAPGKSGATLSRGQRDGRRYVVKLADGRTDWTQHASGVLGGPIVPLWQRGILDRLPDCINQPIVGVACEAMWGRRRTAVLMDDVGQWLIPPADDAIPLTVHQLQMSHLATLHATLWAPGPEFEVVPEMHRYLELSPWTAQAEAAIGSDHLVPPLIDRGWRRLPQVAPRAAAIVGPAVAGPRSPRRGPGPHPAVVRARQLEAGQPGSGRPGPHGAARLGAARDRRPAAAIWPGTWPSTAGGCRNRRRRRSRTTGPRWRPPASTPRPWWDRQLALCLLGALVQFGWEKALGGYDDELAWWEDKAVDGARYLDHG